MKTKLPVHVADDPLHAVAKGTAIALSIMTASVPDAN